MPEDLENACRILRGGEDTCVLCRGETVYKSRARGIAPLLAFWEANAPVQGFSVADRVVGKAAAMLCCLLGVRQVYGQIMSTGAQKVLSAHGILCFFDREVPFIRNRTGDGLCPMEEAASALSDPADAPDAIRRALARLRKNAD